MHYRDGTEAKVGQTCRFRTSKYDDERKYVSVEREGVIVGVTPGATSCNAQVAYVHVEDRDGSKLVTTNLQWVTLGECSRAEMPLPAPAG